MIDWYKKSEFDALNNHIYIYVSAESGPVVPAKSIPIEMMKNIIADIQEKHCRGGGI